LWFNGGTYSREHDPSIVGIIENCGGGEDHQ
jgi:hypothetical protein